MASGEQNITALPVKTNTGVANSDYFMGIDSAEGYQILIRDLAKYIMENYNGSTLAGQAQTPKAAIDALNSSALKRTTITSDAYSNLGNVCYYAGNYILSWQYPTDTSAYYFAFVHKANGSLPAITVIASNNLTHGATNSTGTIITKYNNANTPGVVCDTYFLG